jgi:hypothetical protein
MSVLWLISADIYYQPSTYEGRCVHYISEDAMESKDDLASSQQLKGSWVCIFYKNHIANFIAHYHKDTNSALNNAESQDHCYQCSKGNIFYFLNYMEK